MSVQDFAHLLRTRWLIVCSMIVVGVLGAAALSLLTTPLYQASTRLFVSTSAGASPNEIYQGNLFSQERVVSYTRLLTGETLAQRTIDKLNLTMSAKHLSERVQATSAPNTVLIDVKVLDESPILARDIANALSDEFVTMSGELETPAEGARPDARVVVEQRAIAPVEPVIPKTIRNLTTGLALGVVLGIGLALLRDRLDNTVKTRATLEEITGAGLVANIPFDKTRRTEPAIEFANDRAAIAEAFRELRTNMQFLEVDDPPRVLVVTSSCPSEGKSTTALNLALALAEGDQSVVLVDGDMRRPKVHEYLGLVGTVGFSTALAGRASLQEVLQDTRFSGLTVLAAGATPPNPSELLGSMSAKKLLNELRAHFDYVIVDSSPLLAVTDAAILAAGADGVLVIARFGETKRDQLAQAVGNLHKVGARILGGVFTMIPPKGSESYYYSYYGDAKHAK